MGIFNPNTFDESEPFERLPYPPKCESGGAEPVLIDSGYPPPKDFIRITPGGFELQLDPQGLPPRVRRAIERGELEEHLKPVFRELWGNLRRRVGAATTLEREAEGFLEAVIQEEQAKIGASYYSAWQGFFAKWGEPGDRFPVPVNPLVGLTAAAIYSSKNPATWKWEGDERGYPRVLHRGDWGFIELSFRKPPRLGEMLGALWEKVLNLKVETADVLLIILGRLAGMHNPQDIAVITCKEIADARGVKIRRGSAPKLLGDLGEAVSILADLRLSMKWRDTMRGTLTFGTKEHPDRLIDLVEVQYEKDGKTWSAFTVRAGQALTYFLDKEDGLRWIGYCSRALLQLDPYHDALAKKLGVYWVLNGTIDGKKGRYHKATPETLLNFCGESLDYRKPWERTIKPCIEAFRKLVEIGLLREMPERLEPPDRGKKGYFQAWLNRPITAKLHEGLWKLNQLESGPRTKLLPAPAPNETAPCSRA